VSLMFGHHPWTVQDLVGGVSSGTVRLPDIQRPFVWPNAKVRDLIDSMYRGYPVGELMFWANQDAMHTKTVGGDPKTQDATMQVVDGQQRLTSLYAVLKGLEVWREDYSRERISIAFNPLTERFEVPTPIVKRSPDWIADIVPVFANPIQARSDYLTRLKSDVTKKVDAAVEMRAQRPYVSTSPLHPFPACHLTLNRLPHGTDGPPLVARDRQSTVDRRLGQTPLRLLLQRGGLASSQDAAVGDPPSLPVGRDRVEPMQPAFPPNRI